MLASLEECIGIEKYKVLFFLEPSDSGVIELARAFDATESTVHVNTERLGFYRSHPPSYTLVLITGIAAGTYARALRQGFSTRILSSLSRKIC
jgi:hypothetical protein